MQPIENFVLVGIPERFVSKQTPGEKRLALPPVGGWGQQFIETIAEGKVSAYELEVEASDDGHYNLVQQGTVLAVPLRLSEHMVICGDPSKKKPKTCADIEDFVAVGDTVHVERHYLESDDQGNNQYEISPGVYRLPYTALVAIVKKQFSRLHFLEGAVYRQIAVPIAGYVLLSRVWADDVVEETHDGSLKKVRYSKTVPGLIDQVDVPPLPFEGIAKWVGIPLRGTGNNIKPGDHVLFDPGYALQETICGEPFLVVRQEYCMAVRENQLGFQSPSGKIAGRTNALDANIEWASSFDCLVHKETEPKYFINDEVGQMQTEDAWARYRPRPQPYPDIPPHAPCYDA